MIQSVENELYASAASARILLVSHRNVCKSTVWRGGSREFERIIEDVDEVDILAPGRGKWFKQRQANASRVGKYSRLILNPGVQPTRLNKYYDLMFVICERPSELLNVNVIEGWKHYCRTSVCLLTEFYESDIPRYKSSLKVLEKFDHVLFTTVGVEKFMALVPGTVSYIPPGIDAISFCPYPVVPSRSIDVLSIGRRSKTTHQALLEMARRNEIFYAYDSITGMETDSIEDHRLLLANMAKRSRYFLVNPGKFDLPKETGGQIEFGPRFFEGASAGAILMGQRPANKEFDRLFHWPGALIDFPTDTQNIGEVIRDLDKDPERQAMIRSDNITQSLLHHDWTYRWESVLRISGLEPKPKLFERRKYLKSLAMQAAKA
jgi:hypothetical protein